MQNRRKCWYCKYTSIATDDIVGKNYHVCPHCGMESYQFHPTQLDRALGTRYYVHSRGEVMRVGRERIQLSLDGLNKTNLLTGEVDKIDAYIPT